MGGDTMEHEPHLNHPVRTAEVWFHPPPHTYPWHDFVASGSLGLCPVSPEWGPEQRSSRTVVWSSDPPCARAARLDLDKEPRDIAIISNQYTHEQEAMHLIVQYANTCQLIDYTPYCTPPLLPPYKVFSKICHKNMAIFDLYSFIYSVPLKSERSKYKIP